MNMDLIKSMPLSAAVIVAVVVASACAVLLGWFLTKVRSNKHGFVRKRVDGHVPRLPVFGTYAETQARELDVLVRSLSSAIDRLDKALAFTCTELSNSLSRADAEGLFEATEEDSLRLGLGAVEGRINELKASGINETDIASELSLSTERLQLYMHAGRKKDKAAHFC
jgi:hypothetical protein